MLRNSILIPFFCILFAFPVFSQVKMEKKQLVLPIYQIGAPDINSIYFTGRKAYDAKGDKAKANEKFAKAVRANQNMIWPKQLK